MSARAPGRRRPRRPEIDGSKLTWPGAVGKFALFAEVMWVGVLTCIGSLALITAPAALAASTRHLHRYLRADDSAFHLWVGDFRAALRGGLVVGAAAVVLAGVLLLDLAVASAGIIPGWQAVLGVGILGLTALTVVMLQSAARWSPEDGWPAAVRAGLRSLGEDAGAIGLVITAVVLTAVVTWQLPPLIVPGMGCLVFAVLAVRVRPRFR